MELVLGDPTEGESGLVLGTFSPEKTVQQRPEKAVQQRPEKSIQ